MASLTKTLGLALIAATLCSGGPAARAATSCRDGMDVLLLLDRSGSMKPHWKAATASVNSIVTAFASQHAFGLMLFPDDTSCVVDKIEVPIGYGKQNVIASELAAAAPQGWTPLSQALTLAKDHHASLGSDRQRAVVVITDGVETCDAADSPSKVAADLLTEGVKVFVIAIKVTAPQLDAIAKAGGTGSASVVQDPNDLYESLDIILDLCCGNGVIDQGEVCDKGIVPGEPDACPASCDDGDPCTADRVSCQKTCVHRPVVGTGEDGCCRGGDDADFDPDCTALCGNGVVDPRERCDTAIAAGEDGACSCDDGDPCTTDIVRGCYRSCYQTAVEPDPITADQCCPSPSMTKLEDIDCGEGSSADAGANDARAADSGSAQPPSGSSGCAVWGPQGLPAVVILALLGLAYRRRR